VLSEEKGKGNMKKTAKGIEKSKKYGIIAMEPYGIHPLFLRPHRTGCEKNTGA
jgi:hypothetical protein